MVTKPRSLLLQKKADMLPVPGEGGVGGIDVADRDSLARHTLDDPASPANNYNPFYGKGTELDSLKNAGDKQAYHVYDPNFKEPDRRMDKMTRMQIDEIMKLFPGVTREEALQAIKDTEGQEDKPIKRWRPEPAFASRKLADNSMCGCGHQWHEHWNLGRFGCKDTSCKCKGFKAKTGSVNPLFTSKHGGFDWDKDTEDFRAGLKQEWDDPDGYLFRSEVYCPRCGQALIDELIDTKRIGPPGPIDDKSYLEDSEVVPQPILSLEPGTETCGKCGDDIRPETREPGELNDEDRQFLKEMNISASLRGLSQRVKSANPLLNPQPPSPDNAMFFKESEDGEWEDPEYNKEWLKGVRAGKKPHCPHCGSDDYALMPTDFETAKCNKCGKTWDHGIVPGINDPKTAYDRGIGKGGPNKEVGRFLRKLKRPPREDNRGTPFVDWLLAETAAGRNFTTLEEATQAYNSQSSSESKTAAEAGPEGFPPPQRELDYSGWSTIGNLRKYMTQLYNASLSKEITREEYEAQNYLANIAYEAAKKAWSEDPKYRELANAIDSSEGKHDVDFLKSMGVTGAKKADSTSKSYGMGTPLGGASNVPAPNNTQKDSMDPLQKPQDPWKPPDTPNANTAPEQSGDQIAKEVVKELQEKVSNVELSRVNISDEATDKPERSDIKRHIDKSLLDKDYSPPVPLSKGAGVGEDDEPEGEITDAGTLYGKPIGKRTPPPGRDEWGLPTGEMPTGESKWKISCPKCKALITGTTEDDTNESFYKHWMSLHPETRIPEMGQVEAVPYRQKVDIDAVLSDPAVTGRGAEGRLNQPPPLGPPKKRLRFTDKDKDFLKGIGIKGSKVASMDAETWWKNTVNTKRRELAGKLGIDKYWSHFVWETLPPEVKEKVRANLPQATEPEFELTPEDRDLLGGMKIQAAGKDWNPLLAKELYDQGLEAAKEGDWNTAAKALSQSLKHNPYNGPAHFMMGIIFSQDGDSVAAIEQFQDSLRTSPKDRYPYHGIITEFERRGELDGIPDDVRSYLIDNMVMKTAAARKVAKGLGAPVKERTAAETWWRSCETCGKPALELRKGENVRGPVWCEECSPGGLKGPRALPKAAVQVEEGVNLVCPNCKGTGSKPVEDPEAETDNLMECTTCGAFFAK